MEVRNTNRSSKKDTEWHSHQFLLPIWPIPENSCGHGFKIGESYIFNCAAITNSLPQFLKDCVFRHAAAGATRLNYTDCVPDEPEWRWPPFKTTTFFAHRNPIDAIISLSANHFPLVAGNNSIPQQLIMAIFRYVFFRRRQEHNNNSPALIVVEYDDIVPKTTEQRAEYWRAQMRPIINVSAAALTGCLSDSAVLPPVGTDPSGKRKAVPADLGLTGHLLLDVEALARGTRHAQRADEKVGQVWRNRYESTPH